MKTTALILLSSCLGLSAQIVTTNDTNVVVDTALRDEILRRAVRQYDTNQQTPAPAAAAPNPVTPVVATAPPAATPAAASNAVTTVAPAPTRLTPPVVPAPVPVNPASTPQNNPGPAAVAAGVGNALPNVTATNPPVTPVVPAAVVNPTATTAPPVTTGAVPPVGGQPTVGPARLPGGRPQPPGTRPNLPGAPAVAGPGMPVPGTAPAEPARAVEEADQKMDFPSIDLNTFLGVYAGIVGRTVLHGPLPPAIISLTTQKPLTRTELIQAMDSVLSMNNINMINQGSNFVEAVTAAESPGAASRFSTNRAEEIPDSFQYMSQIVQLEYVKPSEIMQLLQPFAKIPNSLFPIDSSSVLVIRDYAANVKRMMEIIKKVDVVTPIEYEQEVIPIKYAKVADIASALGSLGAGTGASIGTSRSSTGGVGGRSGLSGTGGGYTTGSSLGGTVAPGGVANPFASAGALGGARGAVPPSLQSRLTAIQRAAGGGAAAGDIVIFTGSTKIVADERSHSLLVLAGHQDMQMIKSIIKKLDVVLAQVLIEAIIMEVNLDDGMQLGVSYLQTGFSQPGNYFSGRGAALNGTFLNNQNFITSGTNGGTGLPGGFAYLAHFGNDFDATVTAVASDSRVTVLSKPRIQTSDGVAASLKVGNTIPYVTGTYFGGINGQASSQYTQTFVGIDLEVNPQINSEGLVVMDISQDVQELGPTTTIDGNAVPTTTQRSAASTVSVKDRDTIILGGFISSTKSKSHSGVPLLKDIPVLGNLFRSANDSSQRVELIVLIRPTVLQTPEAAAIAATHERNNMPNLKQADADLQTDENKRLKRSDTITVPVQRQ